MGGSLLSDGDNTQAGGELHAVQEPQAEPVRNRAALGLGLVGAG